MGQIIGRAAKPKRCNLNKLSQLGTPAAGEHILVSSDNSMNAAGQGNFDCYIEGDNTHLATELPLKPLGTETIGEGIKNTPTSGAVFDALANGLIYNKWSHSTFNATTWQNPCITLTSGIELTDVGDYIEMDVNPNGTGFMIIKNMAYNAPYIQYSSANALAIRYLQTMSPVSYSFSVAHSTLRQTIKMLLASKDGTNNVFEVYVDGEKVLTTNVVATSVVSFDQFGCGAQMSLYSFKYKSGGVEGKIEEFAKLSGATGVTDYYTQERLSGVKTLAEQTEELDTRMDAVESVLYGSDMYIRFEASSYVWNAEKCLYIYQRLHDDVYLCTFLILYNTKDYGSDVVGSWGYWRLERTNIVRITDGSETAILNQVLTSGENEFVLKYSNDAANYDGGFTGGYHFGEKIGDEGTFVNILVDGNPLDLSADIPLTPCKSVEYKELSAIYEKVNNTIAAYHFKHTKFLDGGYDTFNKVQFTQALAYFAYLGIVCVGRNVSEYAMPENVNTITDMGTGTPLQSEQFKSNHHLIHYEGGGYAVDIRSECEFGDDDSLNSLVVYNSSTYNKFYRRTQTINGSALNRVGGKTSVRFYAL